MFSLHIHFEQVIKAQDGGVLQWLMEENADGAELKQQCKIWFYKQDRKKLKCSIAKLSGGGIHSVLGDAVVVWNLSGEKSFWIYQTSLWWSLGPLTWVWHKGPPLTDPSPTQEICCLYLWCIPVGKALLYPSISFYLEREGQ